ncbi:putative pantetheine-phosphate adenylyltransferase [Paratrimastix pyriformis]|uniref:Pantetheine-phosphate adenylyltransferase n=1 Tax=Paratrimastix pyriformis TaxID=342808 RepID=A0ABQ8ULH8_9EUKA|nr:putative pantetheine-phosphate adenylyltransferase [Paratrimastix pyriformis]
MALLVRVGAAFVDGAARRPELRRFLADLARRQAEQGRSKLYLELGGDPRNSISADELCTLLDPLYMAPFSTAPSVDLVVLFEVAGVSPAAERLEDVTEALGDYTSSEIAAINAVRTSRQFTPLTLLTSPVLPARSIPLELPATSCRWPLYGRLCLGGTFDHIHPGHKILLTLGALTATRVVQVGISVRGSACEFFILVASQGVWTSTARHHHRHHHPDALLAKKQFAEALQPWEERARIVERFAKALRPDLTWMMVPITATEGSSVTCAELEAIIVSAETSGAVEGINAARQKRGHGPLAAVVIPLVMGGSSKVSSTDLRRLDLIGRRSGAPAPAAPAPADPSR